MVHRLDIGHREAPPLFLGDVQPVCGFSHIGCCQCHIEVEVEFVLASYLAVLQCCELFGVTVNELDLEPEAVVTDNGGCIHLCVCGEVQFMCLSSGYPYHADVPLE